MIESVAHRPRDSAATREALLEAATALFGEGGYERTTIREIAERAGVDSALIARYFGNKAALYIATVAADRDSGDADVDFTQLASFSRWLVARVDRTGPGPILQALVRSDTAEEIRLAASDRLYQRMIEPMEKQLSAEGVDRSRVRAEVVLASLIGVVLGRSLGSFRALASAPAEELLAVVADVLRADGSGNRGSAIKTA